MTSAAVRPGPQGPAEVPGRTESRPATLWRPPLSQLQVLRAAVPESGLRVLALFGTLLLLLSAVLHVGVGAPAAPEERAGLAGPAEFDLRAGPSSPTFNSTSAEAPASPPALAPHLETGSRVAEVDRAGAACAELPIRAATVIEVPEYLRYPHRGETPMMRTWNRLGFPALLAAALAASSAGGQHDGEPDKIEAILNQLKSVSSTLKELENLKSLPKNLTELDRKITDALAALEGNINLQVGTVRRELNALREQYTQLKQEIDALKARTPARQQTTALYPQNGQGTGRLRLVNTFPRPVSIIVNNQRLYDLQPLETRFAEGVSAGIFTYEVLGGPESGAGIIQPRVSRALSPGETFLIHVHPR